MVGPKGEVILPEGAVVAARHVHMHPSDALKFGVNNLDYVQVKLGKAPRDGIMTALCRVHESMRLECHVDTDEANAFDIKNGDTVTML
jgi:putative phosphotransacetylase